MKQNNSVLNILYCEGNTDGTIGGSYFSLLYLVSGLDKTRYNPIVVFYNQHALLHEYHKAGIRTLIIPAYSPVHMDASKLGGVAGRILNPVLRVLQRGVNFARGFIGRGLQYARLIREQDIDVVHLNNSVIRNHDWMLGALLSRTPCITHERGINDYYSLMSHLFGRKLKAIVCISDAVRETLMIHALDYGNLVTIYNGIDPDVVQPARSPDEVRARHNLNVTARILGLVGNIKPWKGQELLIRALPKLLRSHPDVVCLFVGDTAPADKSYYQKLCRLADELGVTEHLRFTGYTNNVADYLNVMEAVIHTSVEPEPFGRVIIEAMSMSKPVVGARAGAIPEIVEEGVTGLTFPPGDADALADAIHAVLLDPAEARRMGERGRRRLEECFDIRRNIDLTQKLYDSLARHKKT